MSKLTQPRPPADDEIDMTPMVDVTFLLLIFFMVTAAFLLQKAMQVPPVDDPDAAVSQTVIELEQDSIVVRIDSDNVFWVGCPLWEEEQRAPSKQEMRSQVRRARSKEGGGNYAKFLVQAHGDALHDNVIAALDAGAAVGVEEIRLASYEDDQF